MAIDTERTIDMRMKVVARTRKRSDGAPGPWLTRSLSVLAPVVALGAVTTTSAAAIPQAADSAPAPMFSGIANRHCAQWADAPPNVSDWFCASTVSILNDEINARGLHNLIDLYDFGSGHQLSVVSTSPDSYCGHSTSYGLVPYLKDFDRYVPYGDCAPTFMSSSDASSASTVVGWPSSGMSQRTNSVDLGFSVRYLKLGFGWKQSEAWDACVNVTGCTFTPDEAEDAWMPSAEVTTLTNPTSHVQTMTRTFTKNFDESTETSETISAEISVTAKLPPLKAVELSVTVKEAISRTYKTAWKEGTTYSEAVPVTVDPGGRTTVFVIRPATKYTGHYTLPTGQRVPGKFSVVLSCGPDSRRAADFVYIEQSMDRNSKIITPEEWQEEHYPTPPPTPTPTHEAPHVLH
ncbi:hypothetical protein [Streptomyces antibioticus]|uniref:hypothetical protein n=1 Tax=Streptomyces antibioticus TaxID=1890 RepID=UPI0033F116A5